MAKRIEIGLTNQAYKRIEELAASAGMKPTEIARFALRHTLADRQGFLTWLNGGRTTQEHAARRSMRRTGDNSHGTLHN